MDHCSSVKTSTTTTVPIVPDGAKTPSYSASQSISWNLLPALRPITWADMKKNKKKQKRRQLQKYNKKNTSCVRYTNNNNPDNDDDEIWNSTSSNSRWDSQWYPPVQRSASDSECCYLGSLSLQQPKKRMTTSMQELQTLQTTTVLVDCCPRMPRRRYSSDFLNRISSSSPMPSSSHSSTAAILKEALDLIHIDDDTNNINDNIFQSRNKTDKDWNDKQLVQSEEKVTEQEKDYPKILENDHPMIARAG